jgi:FkbM family methyltransferase
LPIIYPLGDALSKNLCRALSTASWEPVAQTLTDGDALRTFQFGQPLVLVCSPDTASLRFLRHAWSGTVAVTVDDVRTIIPLSIEEGIEQQAFELPPHDRPFEVSIESLAVAGREHSRCEVWVLGLGFRTLPLAIGRSVRLNAGTKMVYGDWGEFLALAGDDLLPDAIAKFGSWAPDDIRLFQEHLHPGDVVIDVGANIGHHSVVFSKLVGPEGLVIAIEAQRLFYQLVHANALLNRRGNIVPIHAAAGEAEGAVNMHPINYDGHTNFGALGVNAAGIVYAVEGEAVPCHRLDQLLPGHVGGRRVSFVKIDVQAYELFVLRGMDAILRSDRPTIFAEISPYWMRKAGYEFTEIYTLLRDHGYDLIHRQGLDLGPNGYPEIPEDSEFEWDLLAVHPERRAEA